MSETGRGPAQRLGARGPERPARLEVGQRHSNNGGPLRPGSSHGGGGQPHQAAGRSRVRGQRPGLCPVEETAAQSRS